MKKILFLIFALTCFEMVTTKAQITQLLAFDGTNGLYPYGTSLIVSGKNLFGMSTEGGANGFGCIFSLDTNGTGYRDLVDFNDKNNPKGGLPHYCSLLQSGNKFYGMNTNGGVYDSGCVFSVDTDGTNYADILDFNAINGAMPCGSLVQSGNVLYGTVAYDAVIAGSIFSIHTDGTGYKDLHDFLTGTDGSMPLGSMVLWGKTLFGTTEWGGTYDRGTIFCIDTDGSRYKILHIFNDTNGAEPFGSLILWGGKLFGTAGDRNYGCAFSIDTSGNNFNVFLRFDDTDGAYPYSSLTRVGTRLYGLTSTGLGPTSFGTIFSVDSDGSRFESTAFGGYNGNTPLGSLVYSGNTFYGMTELGGTDFYGVVFSFKDSAITTSIHETPELYGQLSVFPNPSTGIFSLALAGAKNILPATIEVFNVLGEKVYSNYQINKSSNYQIDLRSKSNGVYFYRVLGEDGGIIEEGKLVIEK